MVMASLIEVVVSLAYADGCVLMSITSSGLISSGADRALLLQLNVGYFSLHVLHFGEGFMFEETSALFGPEQKADFRCFGHLFVECEL